MYRLMNGDRVICETKTIRQLARELLADPSSPGKGGAVMYEIKSEDFTAIIANLGREFFVFLVIGLPEHLREYQAAVNAALIAEGGIAA